MAFSADDKILVSGSRLNVKDYQYEGEVKLWDLSTGKERAKLKGQFGAVQALALSPDSKTLALIEYSSLEADPEFKLLDVATSAVHLSRKYSSGSLLSLTFTPDGKLFVMACPDRETVTLWEVVRQK